MSTTAPQKITTVSELGRAIREKRKSLGVRQDVLAGMSGVGVRFLSELERGKPTCEISKALQVLERLGLELWVSGRGGPLAPTGGLGLRQ